jgi:hypothetical protein
MDFGQVTSGQSSPFYPFLSLFVHALLDISCCAVIVLTDNGIGDEIHFMYGLLLTLIAVYSSTA